MVSLCPLFSSGCPGHSTPEAELVAPGDSRAGMTLFCILLIDMRLIYLYVFVDLTEIQVEKKQWKNQVPWLNHSTGEADFIFISHMIRTSWQIILISVLHL